MAKSGGATVKLEHPFEFEGAEIKSVTLRRVKGKDLRALEASVGKGRIEASIVLASRLSGLPGEAFDEMDAVDIEAVASAVGKFLPQRAAPEAGDQ